MAKTKTQPKPVVDDNVPATAAPAEPKAKKKPFCPFTRDQFMRQAVPQQVRVGESGILYAVPKEFSTGSYGWYINGQVTVPMPDGGSVKCQAQFQLVAVGSKEKSNGQTEGA